MKRSKTSARREPTADELLDWLNRQGGAALISDDNGHWAVSGPGWPAPTGVQPVLTGRARDFNTHFIVEAKNCRRDVRGALRLAMEREARQK